MAAMPYICTLLLSGKPFMYMAALITLMSVIRIGSRLRVSEPMLISASGAPRSVIGPKDTPRRVSSPDRNLYAAIKNGISRSREMEPFSVSVGL